MVPNVFVNGLLSLGYRGGISLYARVASGPRFPPVALWQSAVSTLLDRLVRATWQYRVGMTLPELLPGMRPNAPRRNVIVALIYVLVSLCGMSMLNVVGVI